MYAQTSQSVWGSFFQYENPFYFQTLDLAGFVINLHDLCIGYGCNWFNFTIHLHTPKATKIIMWI